MNFPLLDGWKTYIAAGLMILTGLAQITGLSPEQLNTGDVTGWQLILAGLALAGIGGKLDKMTK